MKINKFDTTDKTGIILVVPNELMKDKAIEYKKEHFAYGETEINGSELWDKMDNYSEWLEMIRNNADENKVSTEWVVTDTYFAVRQSDEKIIGMIDFRHTLNDFLKDFGNIGYSVRPSERRKGYATEMLRQVLEIAKLMGYNEVYLSCKKRNIPSQKTILRNGGKFIRSFQYQGEAADVFQIEL